MESLPESPEKNDENKRSAERQSSVPPPFPPEYLVQIEAERLVRQQEDKKRIEELLKQLDIEHGLISPERSAGESPLVPLIDRSLMDIGRASPEEKARFIEEKKNLPPETPIFLYHGLNGGLESALAVLNSPDKGVRQNSGPTLALYPVGQFWKNTGTNDAGFRYSVPRGEIEFPGESKPDAKIRVDESGLVHLRTDVLPLDQYEGEVLRTQGMKDVYRHQRDETGLIEKVRVGREAVPLTEEEKQQEQEIFKKLAEFAKLRGK